MFLPRLTVVKIVLKVNFQYSLIYYSLPETDIHPVSGLPKPMDRVSRSNKPSHPSLPTSKTMPNIGSSRIKVILLNRL